GDNGDRLGEVRERFAQGLKVEHRATDQEGDAAAGGDFGDQSYGVAAELCGGVAPGRVDDVDEVVRYRSAFGDRRFRGADVHAAVDLRGIHADDLDRKVARQGRRQRA